MDTTTARGTLPLVVCHTVVECGWSDGDAVFSNTVSTGIATAAPLIISGVDGTV